MEGEGGRGSRSALLSDMDRRHFNRLATTGLMGLNLRPQVWLDLLSDQNPEVNGRRLNQRMSRLASFGANAAGGIDRVAFSDANIEALDWITGLLVESGFSPSIDFAGNLIARKLGSGSELPPIMLGSHIDSVPGGGNYDGQVGSMGALEVAASLADAAHTTRHSLEILIFSNEEGGKTGSRALAGEVEGFELDIVTASGFTIADGIQRLGGNPNRLEEVRRTDGSAEAFLELHIEQGAVLDADEIDVGVVEGIVGIMRWTVTVDGSTNHAGTTPLDRRSDAMVGAARFIDLVHTTARRMPGQQVATVGRLEAEPGVPNVIPGRVTMTLEIRDLSMDGIERVYNEINRNLVRITEETETRFSFQRFYTSRAAPTAPWIREIIETSARGLGLSTRRMPSGAGHDAQSIALFAPVGMIFVPSVAGISHAPDENTSPQDVINGANVLLQTLLELDER